MPRRSRLTDEVKLSLQYLGNDAEDFNTEIFATQVRARHGEVTFEFSPKLPSEAEASGRHRFSLSSRIHPVFT